MSLQIVDATNAVSYFRAINRGDWREAVRTARQLEQRLGPDWRKRIDWMRNAK